MLKYIHQLTCSFLHKQPQFWGQALSCSKTRITPKCKCMFKWLFRGNTFISTLNIDGISSFWENCLKFLAKFEASHLSNLVAYKKKKNCIFVLCWILISCFYLVLHKPIPKLLLSLQVIQNAAKQWKKVEETSSKLSLAITSKKRAADKLEHLQSKRKKLASKK